MVSFNDVSGPCIWNEERLYWIYFILLKFINVFLTIFLLSEYFNPGSLHRSKFARTPHPGRWSLLLLPFAVS